MRNSVISLDHINLSVQNLPETKAWYGKLFGFKPVEEYVRENGKNFAVLRSGDIMLCVTEYPEVKLAQNYPSAKQQAHIYHFGLRVTDRKDWEARLEEFKIPVNYGGVINYPHSSSWYVSDPSGHEIEVVHWDQNRVQFGA